MAASVLRPVELVIFQATPFCNINCTYCYLPDRTDPRRMALSTIEKTCEGLRDAGLLSSRLAVLWHAGEPLAVPIDFYEQAHEAIQAWLPSKSIDFSFQTNGVLLNADWISFFKRWNVQVGLSCDGPPDLHNTNRLTRSGRGTADKTYAAARALKEAGLPLKIVCVLTPDSLRQPDRIFHFFESLNADRVGFNIVEVNGAHRRQLFETATAYREFCEFFSRYFELALSPACHHQVRELTHALGFVFLDDHSISSFERDPIRILSIGTNGDVGTFSPELLTTNHSEFGNLVFSNVHEQDWTRKLAESEKLAAVWQSIQRGVEKCRNSCGYFDVCHGGVPATKLGELGTFDGGETIACQFKIKATADSVTGIVSSALAARDSA